MRVSAWEEIDYPVTIDLWKRPAGSQTEEVLVTASIMSPQMSIHIKTKITAKNEYSSPKLLLFLVTKKGKQEHFRNNEDF